METKQDRPAVKRTELDAFRLGQRAARNEVGVPMCEEHGEDIEHCTRSCGFARYEELRAGPDLEAAIEELPEHMHAIAVAARAGWRRHRTLLNHRKLEATQWRMDHFRRLAAEIRMVIARPGPYGETSREAARRAVADNRKRIAAMLAKAEQWLQHLVLQRKAGAS